MSYKTFAIIVGVATLTLAMLCNRYFKDWSFINSDGMGYYAYLPAIVIDKDTTLQTTVMHIANVKQTDPTASKEYYGISKNSDNVWVDKYPIGLAIVESPFFFGADLITQATGGVRDGISQNYEWSILIAGLSFLQLGMYFTYRVLKSRFGHNLGIFLLTFLLLGTNLMHYSVYEPSMTHIYSFAFISLTIFLLDKYLVSKSFKLIIAIGLSIVVIGLIRNLNILFGIIPLVVIIQNTHRQDRLKLLLRILLFWGLIFLVFFIPQFSYWQYTTGNMFSGGYKGESFNFLNSQILNILFSVKNGLFFWHPLLLLTIPGMYFWIKAKESLSKISIILLLALIYILSCWWAWWFGYAFGMRPFTDFLILFIIPIGYLCKKVLTLKRIYSAIGTLIICLFFALNIIQMNNYWRGIVAGHNISWEVYWNNFANPHLDKLFEHISNDSK